MRNRHFPHTTRSHRPIGTTLRPARARSLAAVGLSLVALAAFGVAWNAAPAAASSIGISPVTVRFENALRGGLSRATIAVFTDSATASTFTFDKTGDAAPWITFYDPDREPADDSPVTAVVAPPEGSDGHLGLKLQVPASTPNGRYTAAVTVLSNANTGDATAGPVNVGAEVEVIVEVTGDQNVSGDLLDAGPVVAQVEVGQPARFEAELRNSGNVNITPEMSVTITGPDGAPKTISGSSDPIPPGQIASASATWETGTMPPGTYKTTTVVRAGAATLGTEDADLILVPAGTLTRQGELKELRVASGPKVGGAARVVAVFANTGQMDAKATFEGELWRDDQLVGPITSPPLDVEPGSSRDLAFVVSTPEAGNYRVTGTVNFSGKNTASKEVLFTAGDAGGSVLAWLIPLIAAGAVLVGVAVVVSQRRRAKVSAEP